MSKPLLLPLGGNGGHQIHLDPAMGNRHGMIAGATGTGKTITLQVLAERFSRAGVPVFLADVKGDLSGLANRGRPHRKIDERLTAIGIDGYQPRPCPVVFWDIFQSAGHPLRTTISEVGPLLLSNLLELNETQTGLLYSCFAYADDNGLLLLDFKDLHALLAHMATARQELSGSYGNISTTSVGAIQRRLLILKEQGAERFFGEPALDIQDLMKNDFGGDGVISVLDVTRLISKSPRLYALFLLWLLSEFYEQLPEVGDTDRPRFVLFFDEAHMLFDQAPKALLEKVEQVVRLIRSKGVGLYFVSQSPLDIPEGILGQLGLKIQHALRAFTPKDRKVVRAVAQTFRANKNIDTEAAITELGIGEALVSTLDEKGRPTPVERVLIAPPESQIGPLTKSERAERVERSPLKGKYDTAIDRESAYESLEKRAEQQKLDEKEQKTATRQQNKERKERGIAKPPSRRQSVGEAFIKSAARSVGRQVGRQLMRGILGSLFGGRR